MFDANGGSMLESCEQQYEQSLDRCTKIFTAQGKTLKLIEEELHKLYKQIDIIGELELSLQDTLYIAEKLQRVGEIEKFYKVCQNYQNTLSLFAVFISAYFYRNDFWSYIEEHLGDLSYHNKKHFTDAFDRVLNTYNLRSFNLWDSYKFVTPIVSHSLIPLNHLDDYFEAVNDFVMDSNLSDDFYLLDEFLYSMHYRLDKPVFRFLESIAKEPGTFFKESCEMIHDVSVGEFEQDEAVVKYKQIPKRMIEYFAQWKDKPRVKDRMRKTRNYSISSPKIEVDPDGYGVYLTLPQQLLKECKDDVMVWQINHQKEEAVEEELVVCELYHQTNYFYSEQKQIRLKPAENYEIILIYDNEMIRTWNLSGMSKGFLLFNGNKRLIQRDTILTGDNYLVVNGVLQYINTDQYGLVSDMIPGWEGCRCYKLQLDNMTSLKFFTQSNEQIEVPIRTNDKPYLSGGTLIFSENENEQSEVLRNYMVVPSIYLPTSCESAEQWIIKINRKVGNYSFPTQQYSLSQLQYTVDDQKPLLGIPLQQEMLIKQEAYGEYEIRLMHRYHSGGSIKLRYVPEVESLFEPRYILPNEQEGYRNTKLYLCYDSQVELTFFGAQEKDSIVIEGKEYRRFVCESESQLLRGTLQFNSCNQSLEIPVQKIVHPISWGWMGLQEKEQNTINWDVQWRKISLQDLDKNLDASLVLRMDILGTNTIPISLTLFDRDKNILREKRMEIASRSNKRIPLLEFISVIRASEKQNSVLVLNMHLGETVSVLLAKFQENLIIENISHAKIGSSEFISWEEKSSMMDREIHFINYSMPWRDPIIQEVPNEKSYITLPMDSIDQGIYGVMVRYQKDDWGFEEDEVWSIPTINQYYKLEINNSISVKYNSSFEKYLHCIIERYFQDGNNISKTIDESLLPSKLSDKEIKMLLCADLFVKRNSCRVGAIRKLTIRQLQILRSRFCKGLNKYRFLQQLQTISMSPDEIDDLLVKYDLLRLPNLDSPIITLYEVKKMWKQHSFMAFVISLRTKWKDTITEAPHIYQWSGEELYSSTVAKKMNLEDCQGDLETNEKRNLMQCLGLSLWNQCHCDQIKMSLEPSVTGSFQDVTAFFSDLTLDKRVGKQDFEDNFYRSYIEKGLDKGIKVHGQTYLNAYIQTSKLLSTKNRFKEEKYKLLLQQIRQDINTLIKRYPVIGKVDTLLSERRTENNDLFYLSGMTIFLTILYDRENIEISSHKLSTWQTVNKLFYKYIKDMYIRDYIIFELYTILGGEKWD